jgi:hypothetical protein
MRAPPPVEYPSALSRTWRCLLSLAVGASIASLVAGALPWVASCWGGPQPGAVMGALADPVGQAILALALGSFACAVVWFCWKSGAASERTLRWDGQDWVLSHAAGGHADQRGDVALMLDLGPWMLVRFAPCAAGNPGLGKRSWLALTLAGDVARWAALRGALWSWRGDAGAGRP